MILISDRRPPCTRTQPWVASKPRAKIGPHRSSPPPWRTGSSGSLSGSTHQVPLTKLPPRLTWPASRARPRGQKSRQKQTRQKQRRYALTASDERVRLSLSWFQGFFDPEGFTRAKGYPGNDCVLFDLGPDDLLASAFCGRPGCLACVDRLCWRRAGAHARNRRAARPSHSRGGRFG